MWIHFTKKAKFCFFSFKRGQGHINFQNTIRPNWGRVTRGKFQWIHVTKTQKFLFISKLCIISFKSNQNDAKFVQMGVQGCPGRSARSRGQGGQGVLGGGGGVHAMKNLTRTNTWSRHVSTNSVLQQKGRDSVGCVHDDVFLRLAQEIVHFRVIVL